jgi:hypothetical protein
MSSRRVDVMNHVKTVHDRIKDHKCEMCHFASRSKTGLDKHVRGVHKDEIKFTVVNVL